MSKTVFAHAQIAFDLDGTLVNTAPDLLKAVNAAIGPLGVTPVPLSAIEEMIGRGSKEMLRNALKYCDYTYDEALIETLFPRLMDAYSADIASESHPFEGVLELLTKLKSQGARLSVCTNKPSRLAHQLVEALDMTHFFDRIIGPEDTTAKKPAADHIHSAFGGETQPYAAMIGDAEPDALSAKAAGIPCLLFTKGYSEKPVNTLGADRLFDHHAEIEDLLLSVWSIQAK